MHELILKLSRMIDSSIRYQTTKSFFRSLLNDINYPYKKYFDWFMIGLIMTSIMILILSKSGKLPAWMIDLDLYFITAIFALEYLLRIWVSQDIHKHILATSKLKNATKRDYYLVPLKKRVEYLFSLPALIDLIAIFPKFRIIRLLKLYHYMHGTSSLFKALTRKRFEFIFLGYMLLGVTFSFGTVFYILEYGVNKNIGSYLDAIYWALVTVSTVGYGDISPVTDTGKIISMFGIIIGIAMISFVTSVMVTAFSERFDELRNADNINLVSKINRAVIINGYGHLGMTIAKKLLLRGVYEPVIIEDEEEKVTQARVDGYKVIRADGSSAKLINDLYKGKNIEAMLTLTSSDIDNIYFILNAKSVQNDAVIYARMNQHNLRRQYYATGVDAILEPYDVVDFKALAYLKRHHEENKKGIIFFGYTHKNKHLCQILRQDDIEVTIYETDSERYASAKRDGFVNVVQVDEEQQEYLEHIKLLKDYIVVCAMIEDALNVYYAISLRSGGFKDEIVALSDSKEDNRKLILAGVSKIFDMYEESAERFIELIENKESI
ncbi:NAD-binding protein [Sulfurovum sp. zt1-1]|uniref:NAD-binding protein n=1 Tax=Sulfurovum zhangzhouensis TaxID=3019067 RepID=A0ABT7QVT5_9BACT|nr:NAD-binding protein [Sulfurovum zhangzhouensis]MDM5270949.1 NAD-binding protein [Sulfurovum zhangzhouensis]